MKKILIAAFLILFSGSNTALACSCQVELPSMTFVALSEVNFAYSDGDYLEFFVNRPENIDTDSLEIELDGKNIYDGFRLEKYNVIQKDLVGTTEQIFVKYGGEIIDAVCWKNSKVSSSEVEDVDLFESLNFGECVDSEEVNKGMHLAREQMPDYSWSQTFLNTPGNENSFERSTPLAKIDIQSGETIGYGEINLNLDGGKSIDENGLELVYEWDFGNGGKSEKVNPDNIKFDEVGSYVIELKVTNSMGGFDEDFLFVTVLPDGANDDNDIYVDEAVEEVAESFIDLRIHDFMANPEGSDTGNEWIDIFNNGESGFGKGWWLDDSEGQSSRYDLSEVYFEKSQIVRIMNSDSKIGLNNSNDSVRVLKGENLIDEISYETTVSGESYKDMSEENEEIVKEDKSEEDTVEVNYEFSEKIKISELMPNPQGNDTGNEWVELLNEGANINLGGWYLMLNSKKVNLDGFSIQGDNYESIEVKGFSNSSGVVQLYDPDDKLIDEVEYDKSVEGNSYSLVDGEWIWTEYVSMGSENIIIDNSEGTVEDIDEVSQTITISSLSLIYKDLPAEVEVGGKVEFKYINDELLEIEVIEAAEITLGGLVTEDVLNEESNNKIWLYILMYSIALIIAFYFRKPLLEFAKTKFGEI